MTERASLKSSAIAVVVVGGEVAATRGRRAVEVTGPLTLPVVLRVVLGSRRCCAKPKLERHKAKRTSAMSAVESCFFTENLTKMLSRKTLKNVSNGERVNQTGAC